MCFLKSLEIFIFLFFFTPKTNAGEPYVFNSLSMRLSSNICNLLFEIHHRITEYDVRKICFQKRFNFSLISNKYGFSHTVPFKYLCF